MYILLASGRIFNCGSKLEDDEIDHIVKEHSILELTKMPDSYVVTNDTVLHNCWMDQVYLDPEYTFHSFVNMLGYFPILKQFKMFAESHYQKYLQTDLNYAENPMSAVMCVFKVTDAWKVDLTYRECMQFRCFEYNGGELDTYSKYRMLKNNGQLTYGWIEENGYGLLGMVPWENMATCSIELGNNFTATYRGNAHMCKYPEVTLFEFVTTMLDNTCNCYEEDMEARNKMLTGDGGDDDYTEVDIIE